MKRDKSEYIIKSVSHALDILESFTRTEDALGVSELSKRLGLHKNNVFRLLATLEHRDYVEQNADSENYSLGPRTLQLGSIFVEQRECRRQARPVLEKLSAETGETAAVAVLRSNVVIYMDCVETEKAVRVVSRTGAILPAHCTAAGKAQLAFMTQAGVERLFPDETLPGLTDKSIRSRSLLLTELRKACEKCHAMEDEECCPEVRGIAVPVRDFSGNVIASIGIIAPAGRLGPDKLAGGVMSCVIEAGNALSRKMGYSGPKS